MRHSIWDHGITLSSRRLAGKARKAYYDKLRDQGAADFEAGKSIDSFQALPLERHTEQARASYEIGWRGAKRDAIKDRERDNITNGQDIDQ